MGNLEGGGRERRENVTRFLTQASYIGLIELNIFPLYKQHDIHPPTPIPPHPSPSHPPPSPNPLLPPSTTFFTSPTPFSLTLSNSFSPLLNISGPTFFPSFNAFNLFFSAPLASLSAKSAFSPLAETCAMAVWRDSVVVGGMGMWSSKGVVGDGGRGLMDRGEEERAVRRGLVC